MAVVKCVSCGKYIDDSEAVMVEMDDTHDAVYCISCSPEDTDEYSSEYDEDY